MLPDRVRDALNTQIKSELYSGYIYLSMSAYAEAESLPGFAHWFRKQAEEELAHALRLFDYVNDRGGKVTLMAVEQPPTEFRSPLDLFERALEHERKVTGMIHDLYRTAGEAGDAATQVMLQWFIDEQVEEEKSAGLIVEQLKRAGDHGAALLMLDRALAER